MVCSNPSTAFDGGGDTAGGGQGESRAGGNRIPADPPLAPTPTPRQGLCVSKHLWLLSLICDTPAPLDRAESKRYCHRATQELSRHTGVFQAIVFPTPPATPRGQADPRETQEAGVVPNG